MSAPAAGTPDAIVAEIDHTRGEIAGTLEALEERLSPTAIWNEVSSSLTPVRQISNDFTRHLGVSVWDNPLPTALIGLGVCWLAVAGRREGSPRAIARPRDDAADEWARLDRRSFDQIGGLEDMNEYTETKDTLRETGEQLSDEARKAAHETGEQLSEGARRAKETGEQLSEGARKVAHEAGERISEGARRAQETGERLAEGARKAAHETGERISEGARRAARETRERTERLAAIAREKSSEAYQRTSEAGARAASLARHAASDGREFARMHPIGVALGVLGVGAIVAAVMVARSERRRSEIRRTATAAKEYLDDTYDRTTESARQGVKRAKRAANDVAGRFKREASTPGDEAASDVERASYAHGPLATERPEEPS